MREIHINEIISTIEHLFIEANLYLSEDMYSAIQNAINTEASPVGKEVLRELLRNADAAGKKKCPCARIQGLPSLFSR